jgi:biopolymer transport protein ExbD
MPGVRCPTEVLNMKPLTIIAVALVIILLLIFFAGCRRSSTSNIDKSKLPSPDSPYVKVFVSKSGEITLDGKPASIDEVRDAFASLSQKKGVVLYARESPQEAEPHPNAMQVINLITQNRLPVRLCVNKDCSDALDENGKLKVDD